MIEHLNNQSNIGALYDQKSEKRPEGKHYNDRSPTLNIRHIIPKVKGIKEYTYLA